MKLPEKHTLYMLRAALLMGCLCLLLAACQGDAGKGQPAPDFSAVDMDGKTHRLSDYKGKLVLLYFWADWCPVCQKEFPDAQQYYSQLQGERNFAMLAVNVGKSEETARNFRQKYGVGFAMMQDKGDSISKKYQVKELPTHYFIAPDGTIARRIVGKIEVQQIRVLLNQYAD